MAGAVQDYSAHLDPQMCERLENSSAIIEWMIVRVVDIISKYAIQDNGRNTCETITQYAVNTQYCPMW